MIIIYFIVIIQSETAAAAGGAAAAPAVAAGGDHINVKVQGQDGAIVHFKIKKSTQFKKLMTAYCERLVCV